MTQAWEVGFYRAKNMGRGMGGKAGGKVFFKKMKKGD
jgi:hypothetical protein